MNVADDKVEGWKSYLNDTHVQAKHSIAVKNWMIEFIVQRARCQRCAWKSKTVYESVVSDVGIPVVQKYKLGK